MSLRLSLFASEESVSGQFGLAGQAVVIGRRYNIAPGQEVIVLIGGKGTVRLSHRQWGLIPASAHHTAVGAGLYQVRQESLLELESMQERLEERRCAVLADGFFLWHESPEGAQPWYFYLADRAPFALAAVWERWESKREEPIDSCAIITTTPNEVVAPVHQRMPVILSGSGLATWLDPGIGEAETLLALCRPYPGDRMEGHKVGHLVDNEHTDTLEVIDPVL